MITAHPIPALRDNYIYALQPSGSSKVVVVDPSETQPVDDYLFENQLRLEGILLTHHHWDHVGGVELLQRKHGCFVYGYAADQERLPKLSKSLVDQQQIEILGEVARIFFIPGHTLGHIAYYFHNSQLLFCGDTLFSIGCGRLFEGSAEQMYSSLQQLAKLPDETQVCAAHEYTLNNIDFALTVTDNQQALLQYKTEVEKKRAHGLASLPSTLLIEKQLNPFIRARSVEEFAQLRKQKDNF